MYDINKFTLDKSNDPIENILSIKNEVSQVVGSGGFSKFSSKIANILDLPREIIDLKLKQLVYKEFNFEKEVSNFSLKLNFLELIKYHFLFIALILPSCLPNLFLKSKIKVDIILDNVEGSYVFNKFKKLLLKFDKSLIIKKRIFFHKKYKKLFFLHDRFFFTSNKQVNNNKRILLKFAKECLTASKSENITFIKFYFLILYQYVKYSNIFEKFDSKILIHDRIYLTCPIRNYIFKNKDKNRNKIYCVQSHIAETTITMFSDIDNLLSFGNEKDTLKKIKFLGGRINTSIPIGSLRMEYETRNEVQKKIDPIDILVIGINPTIWMGTSNIIKEIYYEQMLWLKKISEKFPNLNIVYKHHPTFTHDKKENKIFSDANIDIIVKPKENLNSYHFLLRSKICLSFGSTMIIEGLSHNERCYFLDPKKKNNIFFNNLEYLEKLRISSFEELKELIQQKIDTDPNDEINSNNFCLNSKNVTDRIFTVLSDYK